MYSAKYVKLLNEEARLSNEIKEIKAKLYDLQQAMLQHYERNVAPSIAIAEADHAYDSYAGDNHPAHAIHCLLRNKQ